jgi:hypothetical protein
MKTLIALLALSAAPLSAVAEDSCAPLIPPALKSQILAKFTAYRLPQETDNLAEDIQYARGHSRNPCLGVDTGDFDGDGHPDYLIALTAKNGPGGLVLVALTRTTNWKLYVLDVWKDDRSRLYVSSESAGDYNDVGDYDRPREQGAVDHLKCPHAVALLGETESSAIVYCLLRPRRSWAASGRPLNFTVRSHAGRLRVA